jgi:hypothetical protein
MSNDDNRFNRAFSVGPQHAPSRKPCSQNTSTIWIGRRSDETSKQHSFHYSTANNVTLSYTTRNEHLSPNELHQSEREPTLLRHTWNNGAACPDQGYVNVMMTPTALLVLSLTSTVRKRNRLTNPSLSQQTPICFSTQADQTHLQRSYPKSPSWRPVVLARQCTVIPRRDPVTTSLS